MDAVVEKQMLAAHKAGAAAYKELGEAGDLLFIQRLARKRYMHKHGREAFIAGYLEAQGKGKK